MASEKRKAMRNSTYEERREIRRLTAENRRLSREIDALKQELEELRGTGGHKLRQSRLMHNFGLASDNEILFSKSNYLSYIYSHLKKTSVFHIYRKIINVIRRYSFITTSLKVMSFLFILIETATLFVVSTSAFLVLLVLTVLASHSLALITFATRKRRTEEYGKLFEGKTVTLFYPPKHRAFEKDSFFSGMVAEMASADNSISVIVSPFMFKSTGLNKSKKAYLNAREDGENIIIVRRNYYFSLKKKIIDTKAASVTEIY